VYAASKQEKDPDATIFQQAPVISKSLIEALMFVDDVNGITIAPIS
jgi:hypothetical protein